MSNSPLVTFIKISPNRTMGRSHAIDTITIHCVVGQCSVETLGAVFAQSSKQASSNYGVGYDGRIGMYVEEKDRSWCSSSSANDNRAVTIEVASDTYHPYAVTDAAYNATIKLVADICRRNGIKSLKWSTNKTDRVNHLNGCNMTVHRDYANKACPGDYLYDRMGDIAAKVNEILGSVEPEPEKQMVTVKAQFLQMGDDGDSVKALQILLNGWSNVLGNSGLYSGLVDGIFGQKTRAAVITFQRAYNLAQDGIVGADTWGALLS